MSGRPGATARQDDVTGAPTTGGSGFAGWCLDPGTIGFDLPFAEYVRISAQAGCGWAEVPVGALRAGGPQRVRALLARHGLAPGPFSCPWDGAPNGAVPDELWRERVRRMPAVFQQIRAAGGSLVSAFFRGDRPGMAQLPVPVLAQRCALLADLAGDAGLAVCVEVNDVAVLRDATQLLETADRAPLGLLVDTFHMFRAGLGPQWIAALPPGSVRWVHVSGVPAGLTAPAELPRTRPFDGGQALWPILSALRTHGWSGPLSIEVLPAPAPETDRLRYAVELVRHAATGLARHPAG
ncbi:sugar phosphate isomerase/epimerase family protein [Solwaraspora sp. WMMB335]|uniref:sugar phosphate isomerase/epimerase family protein n=1 Tax=Solwaraspora sp. WMMB335 TaxID=3404118 RepID=UPI003B966D16